MAVLGQPARLSAKEFLHCFLKVGIEPSHAAGEEGVHHALWEVTTEVGLEERDQAGFVWLPVKTKTGLLEPRPTQGRGPNSGILLGSLPRGPLWARFFSGWKRVLSSMIPWPHMDGQRGHTPISIPARPFIPCA